MKSDGPKKVVLRKKGTFKAASPPGADSPSGKRASFPRPEGGKPASRYPVRKPAAAKEAPRKAAVSWRAAVEPKPSTPPLRGALLAYRFPPASVTKLEIDL